MNLLIKTLHGELMTISLPHDLITAIRYIYEPAGMKLTSAVFSEAESIEYGACRFGINGHNIVFRVAKITPTKIGQFVTIWKRPIVGGEIAPLDISDGVTFVIISVSDEIHRGQFIFDRKILVAKDIMSHDGKGGKRGIRVYPPWTNPVAKAALKTQQWQLQYFLPIAINGAVDLVRVSELFSELSPK